MQVSELITQLRLTELKKLSLKTSDSDIIHLINLGVVELYKKFPLLKDSVAITPVIGVTDYRFDSYDVNVPVQFYDTQLLFIESIIAMSVDGVETQHIPTNSTRPKDFSTPSYNLLRINKDFEKYFLGVEIRLAPVSLTKTSEDIPLAPQFMELLRLYIAYKAFSSVSANIKDENNTYFIRFDSAATKLLSQGQFPLDSMEKSLLERRGFV